MKVKTLYNKAEWPAGPWIEEPDYMLWLSPDSMYPCVLRRNMLGAWAGFVGIAPDHPLYQATHTEMAIESIDIYGGVVFTGFSPEDDIEVSPPIRRWWIGFGCMTPDDATPRQAKKPKSTKKVAPKKSTKKSAATYKTIEFVRAHTESLAAQLATFDPNIMYAEDMLL